MRTILVPAVIAAALGLAACDVQKTQEGNVSLPKYDVQKTQEGNVNLPKYDVKGPDVQVSKEEKTVTVPTVKTEEKTITVPDVDIKTPNEKQANANR
jgi:uncharacterized lipoprotein